uniref:Cell division and transport-associated protein TolA n=1 Tax=Candidatus Kentrum sp. TUN TaxID=2126343 RepID=A0A450ZVC0_9GAMM|nr:MAG: Cell division and transport-associated protein TolA [Candidatus Kentron sp. TUN]VFK57697.1 MAG: Cell division and transport-associated protein TolA [Candidatus Kentron sp. TUN]VFK66479.1 MAG: Cell division and transport-associated protein TolA [Candidatus Kentron sp. TUN]
MFRVFLDKFNALFLAIVVHVVFVMILLVSLDWSSKPMPTKSVLNRKVESIQAVVIDEAKVQAELTKIREQEQMARQAEEARLRTLERRAKVAEKRRKEEERKLIAAKKKFKDEQKRQRKKKAREEKAKKEAARKRKKEQERQRKAKEKREAEKKKAARKKKEEERRRKEAKRALERKLAAEQAKRDQRLRDRYRMEYIADIKSVVEHNWIRTTGTGKGLKCKLKVTQTPSGEVVNVSIIASSGNTVFDRSAIVAVFKSSPLPRPKDPSAFDRNIILPFSSEN